MNQTRVLPEVLTLQEAADYLRLSPSKIRGLAVAGKLPGRQVDRAWRFLKVALEDWLRGSDPRAVLLQQAGALADDETLPELRQTIHAARREAHAKARPRQECT
jgi:excisionase family DNA binding protein